MSVSIKINDGNPYPFKVNSPHRQSLLRTWQRLTRLQKSVFYLIGAATVVLLVHQVGSISTQTSPSTIGHIEDNKGSVSYPPVESVVMNHDDSEEQLKPAEQQQPDVHAVDYDAAQAAQNEPPNEDDAGADDRPDGQASMTFAGPTNDRQRAVVEAFKHSWSAYKRDAWGKDELQPLSHTHHTWFNLGLTLIDSLDTMYIMGLNEEFTEARDWVANSLDLNQGDVNMFETTIRVLGGLLSSYHLSGDEVFLNKARELGDKLMPAFSSKSGIPFSDVNLSKGTAHGPKWSADSSTSEATTLHLEFNDLSHVTGDSKYKDAVRRVRNHVHSLPKREGLVPIYINPNTGQLNDASAITLGARGDSYYEYLLKEWVQTNRKDDMLKNDYVEAMAAVKKHLVKYSKPNELLFVGELLSGRTYSPKMDHLVAFLAGTLALGHHFGLPEDHLEIARGLMDTCYQMYAQMPTGLSPEIAYFNTKDEGQSDIIVKPADGHNLLRPETVESLYYMYWLTGESKYQEWGWKIFLAFNKHCRLDGGGYCILDNVKVNPPKCRDKMESFWLGETLKYFYLLFADKIYFPFDEWVFNTEAHPLPVIK